MLIFLLSAWALFAADGIVLRGTVTDSLTRKPVAGAEVSASGSQARAPDPSDSAGRFDLALIPEVKSGALIRVRVEKRGYRVYDQKVVASDNALLQIVLERAPSATPAGEGTHGSDLRLQIQGLSQGIELLSRQQPRLNGEPVFCDTVKLYLVVAHNGEGSRPVLVNDIGMKVERISTRTPNQVDCAVDTLSSKPFGIQERNTYVLDVSDSGRSGRYIESARPGEAFRVNPDNILQFGGRSVDITLKPAEEQVGYNVFVEAQTPGLYRIWFTSNYDASGPRNTTTRAFLLGK